jgi:hypothetical protein
LPPSKTTSEQLKNEPSASERCQNASRMCRPDLFAGNLMSQANSRPSGPEAFGDSSFSVSNGFSSMSFHVNVFVGS